jgi:DNA-binding response OmpR family regulator
MASSSSRAATWSSRAGGRGHDDPALLPRHVGEEDSGKEDAGADATPGTGETVLVVEDDVGRPSAGASGAGGAGLSAIETSDGREAVPILQSRRHIDLMISDVGLPGLNGRQLAEIARETRPDLPILLMTGYTKEAADQAKFLGSGMEIITKPFDVDQLGQRVTQILRKGGSYP